MSFFCLYVAWREKKSKHFVFNKYFCLVLGVLKSKISKKSLEGFLRKLYFKLFHYKARVQGFLKKGSKDFFEILDLSTPNTREKYLLKTKCLDFFSLQATAVDRCVPCRPLEWQFNGARADAY